MIVREAKVACDPEALGHLVTGTGFPVTRIGLEAGPADGGGSGNGENCEVRRSLDRTGRLSVGT
jgi:hypothetical protein